MKLEELQERLVELNGQAHDIRTKAEAEKRDLTIEETKELDQVMADFDDASGNIERLKKLEKQTAILNSGNGRKTDPDKPKQQLAVEDDFEEPRRKRDTVPAEITGYRGNGGFRNLGEMAFHVARASRDGGIVDPRLERLASPTIYGNESSGADGGFAVPPDFRSAIMQTVLGEESLLSRCDQITTGSNNFTQPIDETTPWQTSGGILTYWGGEAGTKTQSKPNLQERTVKLNKLYSLVPMTDELLEDAAAMESYLRRKAPEKIAFAASLAIVQGSGAGQPMGILNSPSLVSVAKESSQVADTLVANNVIKMYSRMYGPLRSGAIWLINQDIEPQLLKLSMPGTDNAGNAVTGWGGMVYLPANGFSGSPFATLFGRPVIATQACETLGDKGDIIFVNLSQYLLLLKSGPNPRVDVSMHLWFDQDMTAFRFVLRLGGIPWWSSTIAARDGSTTYSWAVTVDDR